MNGVWETVKYSQKSWC